MGKVDWHSLDRNGAISHYDIKFDSKMLKNVPAELVEAKKVQEHKHEARDDRKLRR